MKKIGAIASVIAISAMLGAGAITAKPVVRLNTGYVGVAADTIPGAVKKPAPGQVNPLPPQVTPNPVPYPNTVPTPTPMPGVTPNPVTPGVTPTPSPMPVTPNPVTPGVTPTPSPMPVTPNPVSPGVTPRS
ncbi:hypothetical protein [Mucilaginibacter sp. HD30]